MAVNDTLRFSGFASSTTTRLNSTIESNLDDIARFLLENPGFAVRIEGHSDNQGTFAQNEQRANDRARNAVNYLISKGVPSSRIFSRGRGSVAARVPNTSPTNRAINRRVEVILLRAQ